MVNKDEEAKTYFALCSDTAQTLWKSHYQKLNKRQNYLEVENYHMTISLLEGKQNQKVTRN